MRTAKLDTMNTSADPRLRFHHGERVEVLDETTDVAYGVAVTKHTVRLQSGQELVVYADQLRSWKGKP